MESDESFEERWKEFKSLKTEIGDLVHKERINRNLSMKQAADLAGVATSTVSRVERGQGNAWSMFKVQIALGVEVTALWKKYELTKEYQNNKKQGYGLER